LDPPARNVVAQLSERAAEDLAPAQAAELVEILDLEARWENLRAERPGGTPGHDTVTLRNRQRTFEAYQSRLAGYMARYKTTRVPELTPNGPQRLGNWCRTVRAVLLRAGEGCPVHAIEKAHRLAGRIAGRVRAEALGRDDLPETVAGAIRELDTLVRWCDGLLMGDPPETRSAYEVGN
jgi:hypothetical protein